MTSVMKKTNIKKILISCLTTTVLLILTSFDMNKERPKYTLAVLYETSNNACYLMNVDGEERWIYDEQERLEYLEKIKNGGDYRIHYSIIKGNYPEYYFSEQYILHIIPQDSVCRLETRLVSSASYTNRDDLPRPPSAVGADEYYSRGYSNNENLLEAKILKYYLENKKKTK
jgi:hypothetical protein